MLEYLSSYQCYRMPMNYQRTRGFTLVEMSIVLVIIGLILGGVMGGQALVRSARLNSVVTDIHKYEAYLSTFRLKYDALPGDMNNAVSYWPLATYPTMVNGNGNGQITWNTEGYQAWLHLTASEIMPGSYTGTSTGGVGVIGTNVPASRVDGGGYSLIYSAGLYGKSGNWIMFGAVTIDSSVDDSIVISSEAQSIDKKMDDGLADHGNVIASNGVGTTDCITGVAWVIPATYTLTTTSVSCHMLFKID